MQAAVALRAKMELEQRINRKEVKTIEYSADMDQRGDLPPVVEKFEQYHIDTFFDAETWKKPKASFKTWVYTNCASHCLHPLKRKSKI